MATLEEQLKQFDLSDRLLEGFISNSSIVYNSDFSNYLSSLAPPKIEDWKFKRDCDSIRRLLLTSNNEGKFSRMPKKDLLIGLACGGLFGAAFYVPGAFTLSIENFIRYGEIKFAFSDLLHGFLGFVTLPSMIGVLLSLDHRYDFQRKLKSTFIEYLKFQKTESDYVVTEENYAEDKLAEIKKSLFPELAQFFDEKGELKIKV